MNIFFRGEIGNVNDFYNYDNIRNCYLFGLADLYGASDYVQATIAAYLQSLIDIGVAGIRMDVAKHMWPAVLFFYTITLILIPHLANAIFIIPSKRILATF